MAKSDGRFKPRARQDGLIVKELSGELLVYDRARNKAHSLNEMAALIWKHCDGQTTVPEIRELLREEAVAPIDEEMIWFALDQFARDRLLERRLKRPSDFARISRRELIQRLGVAASIPLVVSVFAPTVFAAASCTQACTLPINCTIPGCPNCPLGGGTCTP